ncbi:MAG: PilZ domain-containing protein [Candidatus Omnitrophica bacterium]|nr:PilZ domain-containing protein [Candidatus Omnitrophota bacterium]
MLERRKYVRVNGLVLVNFKVPEQQIESKSSAFDVCGAGLRITVDKKLTSGSLVEMEIYLPGNSQPIMAKGEVVWTQDCKQSYFYTGIKFTSIDEKNKERIINYAQRKTQLYKGKP